jgi:streptogramin lyase
MLRTYHFWGLSCDSVGRVYVTEFNDHVYRFAAPDVPEIFIPNSPYGVDSPQAVAVDAQGNVWVSGWDRTLKAFDPNAVPLVPYPIAGSLGNVYPIALRH